MRPFSTSAGVSCRSYSLGLQRLITDFGADMAFGKVPKKMREHHGIEIPESAVRAITEQHAEAMETDKELATELPVGGVAELIGELDGSFVPVVSIAEPQQEEADSDARKRRQLGWKEARLCLVRNPNSVTGRYAATMEGPNKAGDQFVDLVIESGGGLGTNLHGIGDGAPWIAALIEKLFDGQATYLIDFYHLSEYLAAAAEVVGGKKKKQWLKLQQGRMKENQVDQVLVDLDILERTTVGEKKEQVQACKRYLSNRLNHLDYKRAIAAGLPIGSGEVESGHRWVIQARIKLPGAWWKIENISKMLALRVTRANGQWDSYWHTLRQAAA